MCTDTKYIHSLNFFKSQKENYWTGNIVLLKFRAYWYAVYMELKMAVRTAEICLVSKL